MRIKATDRIAHVGILEVRRFLSLAGGDPFIAAKAARSLKLSPARTAALLSALVAEGYLVPAEPAGDNPAYVLTIRGHALGGASATRPTTRATADRVFCEFLARIERVNADPDFVFRVEACVLFGSYLTTDGPVSDIDLAVDLKPKDWPNMDVVMEASRQRYLDSGRRFATMFDRVVWPRREVLSFLKSRSTTISLAELSELDGFLRTRPHKVLAGSFPASEAVA